MKNTHPDAAAWADNAVLMKTAKANGRKQSAEEPSSKKAKKAAVSKFSSKNLDGGAKLFKKKRAGKKMRDFNF